MAKQKNAKGAGRPAEIAGAVLWRGYISGANYDFINRLGPRQASEQVRLALDAAEAGELATATGMDAEVERLQAQVARLERELAEALEKIEVNRD